MKICWRCQVAMVIAALAITAALLGIGGACAVQAGKDAGMQCRERIAAW